MLCLFVWCYIVKCRKCGAEFEPASHRRLVLCEKCLEEHLGELRSQHNKTKALYRNEASKLGICIICGKRDIAPNSKKRCLECVERMNRTQNRWSWIGRITVLMKLGGKCAWCGNTDLRVLEIDHVQSYHHRKRGLDWLKFSHKLKVNESARQELYRQFEKGEVQILCRNCQKIKSFNEMKCQPAFDEALACIGKL